MNLTNIKRKPHSIKKIIKKSFLFFINDQWTSFFYYLITEFLNNSSKFRIFNLLSIKICPICKYSSNSFHHLSNHRSISWNSACPKCDSRSRHRGLFFLYRKYISNKPHKKVLHFAPEIILSSLFTETKKYYFTTDLFMNNVNYPKEDIQNLSFKNATFDMILCNHVLEHVKSDTKAFSEISRILKKKGIAIITVPGNWRNKKTISQNPIYHNGHYRHYGLDMENLMKKKFKKVKKINMYKYNGKLYAIKKLEFAYICEK